VADFHGRFENPRFPAFSPDGRYVAFQEQGAIRVLALDRPNAVPQTVWERGMVLVRWNPDGTSILATAAADGSPHTVDVRLDPSFSVTAAPRPAANWPIVGSEIFDVSADGEWAVLPTTPDGGGLPSNLEDTQSSTIDLHFIVNYAGLLDPAGR
jgi:WD40 repeat protein